MLLELPQLTSSLYDAFAGAVTSCRHYKECTVLSTTARSTLRLEDLYVEIDQNGGRRNGSLSLTRHQTQWKKKAKVGYSMM